MLPTWFIYSLRRSSCWKLWCHYKTMRREPARRQIWWRELRGSPPSIMTLLWHSAGTWILARRGRLRWADLAEPFRRSAVLMEWNALLQTWSHWRPVPLRSILNPSTRVLFLMRKCWMNLNSQFVEMTSFFYAWKEFLDPNHENLYSKRNYEFLWNLIYQCWIIYCFQKR